MHSVPFPNWSGGTPGGTVNISTQRELKCTLWPRCSMRCTICTCVWEVWYTSYHTCPFEVYHKEYTYGFGEVHFKSTLLMHFCPLWVDHYFSKWPKCLYSGTLECDHLNNQTTLRKRPLFGCPILVIPCLNHLDKVTTLLIWPRFACPKSGPVIKAPLYATL